MEYIELSDFDGKHNNPKRNNLLNEKDPSKISTLVDETELLVSDYEDSEDLEERRPDKFTSSLTP
jgi:hypothetical protein